MAKTRKQISADYNARNKEKNALKQKAYYQRIRFICLRHYSGEIPFCACCNETHVEFLAIDHVEGGGNKHRKEIGKGSRIYLWLIRNGFPSGFQVLCHNCNMAKGFYKQCPHKTCQKSPLPVLSLT